MGRGHTYAVAGVLALVGCQHDPLSDPAQIAAWANAASALGVFTHGYEPLAFADGQLSFADPECPVTSDDGTTRFDLPAGGISLLVSSSGDDTAILPQSSYMWDDGKWSPRPVEDQLRWYVFDDRGMYRPGEQIHVKGWLRRGGGGQSGDVGLVGAGLSGVDYRVIGPQGNELGAGQSEANGHGRVDMGPADLSDAEHRHIYTESPAGTYHNPPRVISLRISEQNISDRAIAHKNQYGRPYQFSRERVHCLPPIRV